MSGQSGVSPEILPLPKGGGAIRSIGETFSPDLHTGTGSYRIPLRFRPGPGGFQPEMGLVYTSGGGNGPFGMGWLLPLVQIARKTDQRLPSYDDAADSFVLERQDLVNLGGGRYRQRKEEQFRRVVRSGDGWEVRDRSGRTFVVGTSPEARIEADVAGATHTFAWLIERASDRNGNTISYSYARDRNQLYLESLRYGLYSVRFHYEPRSDVITDRRAGFDIITALRCSALELRLEGAADPLLLRYTLEYDECTYTGISQLARVTLTGHREEPGGPETVTMPVLRMRYTPFTPGHRFTAFRSSTGDPPPSSLEDPHLDLLDLLGTGLPGVIELRGPVRRFWPNEGNGRWGPPRSLRQLPSSVALGETALAFADMNGDGSADLVALAERPLGYFRNTPGVGFTERERFRQAPNFDLLDPQLRLVDLNSDGLVDAIRTGQEALQLFYNRGEDGWDAPRRIPRVRDLKRFPDLFFSDPRVKFADMSGDGQTDIVWAHGSALDWWPHYGDGRFGGQITLPINPPIGPRFDPGRLFLSDVNGDGVADLVYVEAERVRLWINRGGLTLVNAGTVDYTPEATPANVRLADLAGAGTLGLVWSYPPERMDSRNFKYLDFTGGRRPYLLEQIDDGTGLVTEISYRPSTEHRMQAAREGRAWRTPLPFPVQTITKIIERDTVTGRASRRSISYYDGWFDGASREFRGFGRVELREQGDAEAPDTLTISVFHQGEGGGDAWALVGKLLRLKVYGPDGGPEAELPFRVEENQYDTRLVEAGVDGGRSVFPFLARTGVSTFERGGTPIVASARLSYDEFGNPTRKEDEWAAGAVVRRLTTNMAYSADTARWTLNLPVELSREDEDGDLLSLVRFFYDGPDFVGLPLGQVTRGNLSRREELVLSDALTAAVYGAAPPDFATLGYHRVVGPGGVQGWAANTERTAFDASGNVVGRMDALGNSGTITMGSDATYPVSVSDTLGHVYPVTYDLRAGEIATLREPNGHETRYSYDAAGRMVAMVRPGDNDALPTTQFEHLQDSLPLAVRTRLRERPGDPATVDNVEYYDGFKRTIQQRFAAEGGQVLVDGFRSYDARGWEALRTAQFYSAGFTYVPDEGTGSAQRYRFRRDALGRIVSTITPDGRTSRLIYEAGRVTAYDVADTDDSPAGLASGHFDTPKVLEYDAQGRLLAVTEDAGSGPLITRYSRDILGRLTAISDARGVETARYSYDMLGRKIEVLHVDTGRRRVAFNVRGEIVLTIDATGRQIEQRYDALGRLAETTVEGASAERYFYDAGSGTNLVGRLAQVEDEVGAIHFSYSARGLITSKRREVATLGGIASFTIGFAYDSLDRMTRVVHPDGATTDYVYNPRSLVSRISGVVDRIEYNEFGQRTGIRYTNGVEQIDRFDALTYYLEGSRITGPAQASPYYDLSYGYDPVGNPLAISDTVATAGHNVHQRQYSYDALYRLTRSAGSLGGATYQHDFAYDGVGNFTRNEEFVADELFLAPGGSNRIGGTVAGGVQTPLFGYDANGNLTGTPDATLSFDARGRLRRVTRINGTVVELAYDHQGERVRRRVTAGGVTRETIYIDGLFERDNGRDTRFLFHKDTRVAAVRAGSTFFYHYDHRGSVVLITDGTGAITQEVTYNAFGAVAANSAVDPPQHGFLGNEADADTGLIYCQSRYYDPRLGRFVSPDLLLLLQPETVLEMPQGLNLYSYAGNNPVKLIDKEGAWWKWLVGALVIAALVVATVVVGIFTGGAGFAFGILLMASIGSALGAGVGTYAAWRGGGNLEDGFLFGALVGGAAGAAGYAVGAAVGAAGAGLSGAWGAVLAGAAEGAILGAANGAIVGFAGGAGSWKDILIQAGVGALIGAALGGLSGYVSHISAQGGALKPGTFEKALGEGTAKGTGAYGQPIQQTYSTGLAPVGRALDGAARSTLNSIIHHTAQPMVYVSLGSVTHAAVYHDWDPIRAWLLETFGGEKQEVIVNGPGVEWG